MYTPRLFLFSYDSKNVLMTEKYSHLTLSWVLFRMQAKDFPARVPDSDEMKTRNPTSKNPTGHVLLTLG